MSPAGALEGDLGSGRQPSALRRSDTSSFHRSSAGSPAPWRLLRTPPAPGTWNMAVDECLMESVRAGGAPTLRFYQWSPACLSLGRNQPARGVYPPSQLAAAGIEIVRRRTGGRAVLHDDELTYSVVAPSRLLGSPRTAYRLINRVLLAGLTRLGIGGVLETAATKPAPIPSTTPCFAEPLPGEVLVGGRKLVGSAQLHVDGVLLQHGSILLRRSPRAGALEAAIGIAIEGSAAYLADAIDTPPRLSCICGALESAWSECVAPLVPQPLTSDEEVRAAGLARDFEDDRWTWRS